MFWANFLHIYQPPTQKKDILERVVRESYRVVFAGLLKIPKARLTINFNSCLTELLINNGFEDIVKMVKELARRGQIEFTASAKYHPLLPKLPENEVIRQIKLDAKTNQKYFGSAFKPVGFFPPEMAFNLDLAKIIAGLGFAWVIVDEFSLPAGRQAFPAKCIWNKVYKIKNLPLGIYFRERELSFKILSAQIGTESMFIRELGDQLSQDRYLLTAMDGETFGHHRLGLEELLFELYRSSKFESIFISDLTKYFPQEEIEPLPSTWALMRKDIERKLPFARWDDPENKIHQLQWRLTDLAIKAVGEKEGPARQALDTALHSDQYWWAGAKPWWSIEYIEAGAKALLETVKLSLNVSEDIKYQAQDLYFKILTTAFDWQRTGRVARMAKEEDEEIRQRTDEVIVAKKEEIRAMIKTLKKQMFGAAKHREYERAAQLRNRIKELEEYVE